MHIDCKSCGQSEFRASRFRMKDVFRLLALHYPVRCRVCKRRQYISIFLALRLPQAKHHPMHSPKP